MATFIDDQGCTGWLPGSHPHFRLAAAYIPTASLQPFKLAVQALRVEFGFTADFEFKFSKTHGHPETRAGFYNAALSHGLRFTVCAFDKGRMHAYSLDAVGFHQICVVTMATHLRATYREAEAAHFDDKGKARHLQEQIVVDDNADRALLAAVEEGFRALPSAVKPKLSMTLKPFFRDSKKDDGVQLADMVMGAVGHYLDEGDRSWYDMIRHGGGDLGVVEWSGCAGDGTGCLKDARLATGSRH